MSEAEAEIEEAIERLTHWLSDKPEDVWLDCVERVNWDEGGWILLAIVSHAQCTKQIAARIFWSAGAYEVAKGMAKGRRLEPDFIEGDMVIERILQRWHANAYETGSIALSGTSLTYQQYLADLAPHADPLNVPEELFKKFEGRMPKVDPAMTPEHDPAVWDLYHPLDLAYDPRPGTFPTMPPNAPYRKFEDDRFQFQANRQKHFSTTIGSPGPSKLFGIALTTISLILLYFVYRYT